MSKQFDVEVRRTEVRTLNVKVAADNEAQAEAKAIEQAADRDFYSEGRSASVDYEVDMVEELENALSAAPTREQQYLASGGNCCPACGSAELDCGTLQSDGLEAWRTVECGDCGASRDDHYRMTGISDADGFEPDAPAVTGEVGA